MFAHRRSGSGARAYASKTVTLNLASRCQGARTPVLLRLSEEEADPLTAREREIGMLAASSPSSPQIAHMLSLSPRTVDNHLQQVYRKFGITSRRELSSAFAPQR
jgi:DNA-binding CsgD family transcriptional regulator